MRQTYSVRLHRMACRVGIVANVGIVKVCDAFLVAGMMDDWVQRGSDAGHVDRSDEDPGP
jgi:hypothetical protein